ncbi:hypothetical protein B0H19DRAFT_183535 [Mycena capillaripes]|nr:hypothetical protein B0H19DRAFT_183535 [Mycena capillaripes]
MLRDAIIPWSLRFKIHARAAVEDGEDASEAPLTPEATAALEALLNGCKLTNGKPALSASNFPSCFYADGAYDPADPRHGLLRSPFLLRVARHIWTAPASAMDAASKLKKNCAARAHGKYIMTPEMLGYVGCQARTMLSTSAWTSKDGKYDYEKLFDNIVQLCEPNPEDPDDLWAVETFAWYQKVYSRRFRCFRRRRRRRRRLGNGYDPRSSRRSELHSFVRLEVSDNSIWFPP